MDLVDIIEEKRFVGQEFLTWLYFIAETAGQVSCDEDVIPVSFEPVVKLEKGEGEAHEAVACRGGAQITNQPEAITGISVGKKIAQAKVYLAVGDYEFTATIDASTFKLSGVKLPKTEAPSAVMDSPEEQEGRLLERVFLTETLFGVLDRLFEKFLIIRLDQQEWLLETEKIQSWLQDTVVDRPKERKN